jgi:acetyl esterase/lipase
MHDRRRNAAPGHTADEFHPGLLKELSLPLPGGIAAGSPLADLTKTGDTQFTNEYIDSILVSQDVFWSACNRLYARGHDLRDPLLSPVYGDFRGFPPAILISGTRDLLLSDTVRTHRKLREAGVEADLHVFEGQSHCQYLVPQTTSLEAQQAYGEIARFFERHLGR